MFFSFILSIASYPHNMRWMKLSFALSSHDSWYIIFGLCIVHMILVSVVFVGLSCICWTILFLLPCYGRLPGT